LHEIGLSIAATCTEADLVHEGGQVGAMLFRQSREKAGVIREHNARFRRRPITLATNSPSAADDEDRFEQQLGHIDDAKQDWNPLDNGHEREALQHQ